MPKASVIPKKIAKLPKRLSKQLPPAKVAGAVSKIRDGVTKLQQIMVPPHVAVLEMVMGMWTSKAIGVCCKIGVADYVADKGTHIDELAKACSVKSEPLYRTLRALASAGVFFEEPGQIFRHTPMSQCMKTDHPNSMRYMAIYQSEINWEHWEQFEYCVKTGKNAVEKVHGEKPFEHFAKHPEKAEIFDRAMTNITRMGIDAVINAYDFSGFKTLCDVGGGYGTTLFAILDANPKLKGILFDLPHVVEGARKRVHAEGISDRVEIEKGSFFESVPEGADAYIMKHIIHDWSDEECVQILKNIRKEIPKNGKLLLVESVIAERNVPHFSKFLDLEMLVVTTGKERTKEEYAKLLGKAGFKLLNVIPTVGPGSILEASPI